MSDVAVFDDERKKWFQYDKDTEVGINHINKEELNDISDRSRKEAKKTGQEFSKIHNRRFGNAAVFGWRKRKVIDPKNPDLVSEEHPGFTIGGKPLPFTKENLAMLMAKSLKFSNFVNETALDADEFLDGVEETKNAS